MKCTEIYKTKQSNYAAHYTFGIVTVILPVTHRVRIWKRRFHSENGSNVFRLHYAKRIWKRNKSSDILFSNPSGFRGVLKKLRLLSGLVWTVGITVEIKLLFQIPQAKYEWGMIKVPNLCRRRYYHISWVTYPMFRPNLVSFLKDLKLSRSMPFLTGLRKKHTSNSLSFQTMG